jgi:hypothetical protein
MQGTRYASEPDMKNLILGSIVAVTCCIAVPFAQDQRAPAPTAAPAHNVYVLTGCLMTDAVATPTFKLTDATSIGQATPGRAGIAGAVGTSGQKATYELRPVSGVSAQGLDADALKAHLGNRVEVVVRPVESPAPPAPAAGLASAETAKPKEPVLERFTVTEIKRAVGRCS